MASVEVEVRTVMKNPRAIKAFWRACDRVGDAAEDYPWSEDLKEAMSCLVIAAKGLHVQARPSHRGSL